MHEIFPAHILQGRSKKSRTKKRVGFQTSMRASFKRFQKIFQRTDMAWNCHSDPHRKLPGGKKIASAFPDFGINFLAKSILSKLQKLSTKFDKIQSGVKKLKIPMREIFQAYPANWLQEKPYKRVGSQTCGQISRVPKKILMSGIWF